MDDLLLWWYLTDPFEEFDKDGKRKKEEREAQEDDE